MDRREFIAALPIPALASGTRNFKDGNGQIPVPEKGTSDSVSIFEFLSEQCVTEGREQGNVFKLNVASALQKAIDTANGRIIKFGAGVFQIKNPVFLSAETHIDLNGGCIQIVGNSLGIVGRSLYRPITVVLSESAKMGIRRIIVHNPKDIKPGQWAYFRGDSPEGNLDSLPPSWGRIESIDERYMFFDRALPMDCRPGSIIVALPHLLRSFSIRNGCIDGSLNNHNKATGQGVRVSGYENVVIENVEFLNFNSGQKLTSALQIFECIDVFVRGCRFKDGVSSNNIVDLQTARCVEFTNNIIIGDHFGVNITRADYGKACGNTVIGLRKRNDDMAVNPPRSTRGIKFYGCAYALISSNHCSDFESPIKVESCRRYIINGNYIINAGLAKMNGQVALNIGSQRPGVDMHSGVISGNIVENCGGIGIGISSDVVGRIVVTNNVVKSCGANAIRISVGGCIVTGNQIIDWDALGKSYAGISMLSRGGGIIKDNYFHSADVVNPVCIATENKEVVVADNVLPAGGLVLGGGK